MVGGQLHNEGGRVTRKSLELLEHDAGDDHRRNADEEGGSGHQGAFPEDGTGKQADDGDLGATGDESGGHDGHFSVTVGLDGAGGHDAGHAAAGGHQQRDEALAGQAEAAEDSVHNEGDTGHIAHILQNSQQEAEYQDLGHKAQHRAHTGHNAVLDQAVQPGGHHRVALGVEKEAVEESGDDLTEKNVVGPVGAHGADGERETAHGDGVDHPHDHHKDGQSQDAVGDDTVDAVGGGHVAGAGALVHRFVHHLADVGVALVGDDAFSVVIHLVFAVPDMFFQVIQSGFVQLQFLLDALVPLKQLDGIPAQEAVVHLSLDAFFDMSQGVFHTAGEHMGQFPRPAAAGSLHRHFGGFCTALPFQGADLNDAAAQFPAEFFQVDAVTVLAHPVDHIHRHDHRQAQFDELGGQVKIALDVGAVDDVEDGVRLFGDQVAPGHHLLQSIRRKRINARKILNDYVLVALEAAFLLFHRNTGPIAHVLIGAGQIIEQGGFATVRVAGQCDLDTHA